MQMFPIWLQSSLIVNLSITKVALLDNFEPYLSDNRLIYEL
jgi:hypothetical protein